MVQGGVVDLTIAASEGSRPETGISLVPPLASPSNSNTRLEWAFRLSWLGNWLLLVLKIFAFSMSGSKAVLASLIDSIVDLVSQCIVSLSMSVMHRPHKDFPIGRNRLEALAVIACALIMSVASAKVIQACVIELKTGIEDHIYAYIELGLWPIAILVFGTFAKLALYLYCAPLQQYSDSVQALTEDHLNDIMSNSVSMVAALITVSVKGGAAWWVDPVGGLIISLWIIWRWLDVLREQVYKLVGKNAPAEFVERISQVVRGHHAQMELDVVRVYYFGSRFAVEVEVVLPWNMTLLASHDICLNLQHKIEAFDEVERCHVHADYMKRDEPEHKPEREVGLKRSTLDSDTKPLNQHRATNDYGSC